MINAILGLIEAFSIFFAILFVIALVGRLINKDR
jgi:hypothetical protein